MLFLYLIEFILYVIGFAHRKQLKNGDIPSLAEIFRKRKQRKISASLGN
jgi:hypothetical protein